MGAASAEGLASLGPALALCRVGLAGKGTAGGGRCGGSFKREARTPPSPSIRAARSRTGNPGLCPCRTTRRPRDTP